jgi:hypothetical protein
MTPYGGIRNSTALPGADFLIKSKILLTSDAIFGSFLNEFFCIAKPVKRLLMVIVTGNNCD